MNHDSYMRIVSGEARGSGPALCRASFSVLSSLYLLGWAAREAGFRAHVLPTRRAGARVISIGNITAGGTGKTPAVIYFARSLQQEGARVAVVSRGYGRRAATREPVVVSDAEGRILVSPDVSGDEPYLLAAKLRGAPVVVCGDRVKAANLAVERFSPDTILLDDGFQHRFIERDRNIVVIDCTEPFGYGRLLPRGLLREPLWALRRATDFLLTRVDERRYSHVVEKLKEINPSAEILLSRHRPSRLISTDKKSIPLAFLKEKKVFAVSSIGNPQAFERTLQKLQATLAGSIRFPDHHWYSADDVRQIQDEARRCGAEHIVTTEKDGVRLDLLERKIENLLLLEIELEMIGRHPGLTSTGT